MTPTGFPGSAERDALWARLGAAEFLSDAEKREAAGYQRVAGKPEIGPPTP